MKKVLSLVLAVVMVVGLSSVAFAATKSASMSVDASISRGVLGYSGDENTATGAAYASVGTVEPGAETHIYFMTTGGNPAYVPRAEVRSEKLDVKIKASEGSRAIDGASIKYMNAVVTDANGGTKNVNDAAYIKVEYIDPWVSVKEIDFTYTLYLTQKKSRVADSDVEISGTLENQIQTVDEDDDYVDTSDTPVVEALAYVKEIEVNAGEGISIYTKMFKDKKYYAQASQEIKDEDDEIITRYPAIDTIYYLDTVNLNSAANYITIDVDDKLYVYNADLEYLGTTAEKLAWSPKYYVATSELDVDYTSNNDYDTIPSDVDSDNVPSGGDDVPSNVNENPGTGR